MSKKKSRDRYAILLTDGGGFLYVAKNPSHRDRRKLVDDLNDATLWTKIGHAKSAIVQAVELKFLPATTRFSIVTVGLRVGNLACRVQAKVVGKWRTRKAVIVP